MNATPAPATSDLKEEQPSFVFFRTTPGDMMKHPPLASSLQSFETTLLLIALGRFPSALASCAAAVESVIKAKLRKPPEDQVRMRDLIEEIRARCASLRLFDESNLEDFRQTRNRVVHYGYTPKDDEVCAVQLLKTGFPFLQKCYSELFGFNLVSRQATGSGGLQPRIAEQYEVCRDVYMKARQLKGIEYRYCFESLAHAVRFALRSVTMSVTERNMVEIDEESGVKHEHERRAKERIARQCKGEIEEFDCPICRGSSSVMAELDVQAVLRKQVSVSWCLCVSCGMLISHPSPYLADRLLRPQLEGRASILKEFGIE